MCTIVAKQIDNFWVLGKTRDPVEWMRWDDEMNMFDAQEDACRKLIVQNPDPHEDGYYGGINEHGVAYVSTFVRTSQNAVSYIRRPYVRLILDAKTANEAMIMIKSFNPRICGNMFVADKTECFGIEASPDNIFLENVKTQGVKANHFLHLDAQDIDMNTDDNYRKWSQMHLSRGTELLQKVRSTQGIIDLLRDRKNNEQGNAICTTKDEEECFTHSAFVFDTGDVAAHYAQGNPLEVSFKQFTF